MTGTIRNTASVSSPTPDPVPGNNTDFDDSGFTGLADLTIVKSAPATVNAGENLAWLLVVTNLGPSDSVGTLADPIVVRDTLPAGVVYVSFAGTGWSCTHVGQPDGSPDGGVVTCDYAATIPGLALPPPTPVPTSAPPLTINTTVLPTAGPATLHNNGQVSPGVTDDPDPGNNTDSAEVTVADLTDMTIAKTANPTMLDAGGSTRFTIVATNAGPSQADDVTVTDTVPTGMSITGVVVDPSEWSCTNDAATFTCSRPALLPGDAPPILVDVVVGSGVPTGSTLVNEASVSTGSPETDEDNNTDEAEIQVVADADLSVVKSHPIDPVVSGSQMTFLVEVHNEGPSDAIAPVQVIDTLPLGFLYVSNTGPWECDAPLPTDDATAQVVTCVYNDGTDDLPLVALGDAAALVLTVSIDPSVVASADPTQYVNNAAVSSPTPDPIDGNNDWDDPVNVVESADLSIVKTHDAAAVHVGDVLAFTLLVSNSGTSIARDVVVSDTVPAGLTYLSVDAIGWTCDDSAAPTITCALDDDLAVAAAPPIVIRATVGASAYPLVTNTALVTATTPDPDPTNNASVDQVAVPAYVDLAITKTHDVGTIQVGGTVGYTLVVSNNGPTPDPGPITITDTLPVGLTPTTVTGAGLNCGISNATVTCTSLAPLAVGASLTVKIGARVDPAAYPSVTNTATVSTPSAETTLANNSASTTDPVDPLVVLELTKSLDAQLGGSAVWAFRVTNLGPSATVVPIVVTDPLPAGLTYVGASGDGWICEAASNTVTCTYTASLAAGTSAPTLRIGTQITAAPGSSIVNTASASGGGPGTPQVASAARVSTETGSLPITGGDPATVGRIAALVAALGLLLLLTTRRRRSTPT